MGSALVINKAHPSSGRCRSVGPTTVIHIKVRSATKWSKMRTTKTQIVQFRKWSEIKWLFGGHNLPTKMTILVKVAHAIPKWTSGHIFPSISVHFHGRLLHCSPSLSSFISYCPLPVARTSWLTQASLLLSKPSRKRPRMRTGRNLRTRSFSRFCSRSRLMGYRRRAVGRSLFGTRY